MKKKQVKANNKKDFKEEMKTLAGIAHKRESEIELNKLLSKFHLWKKGTLQYTDLNLMIHEFHDIINRNIWKTYNFDDDFIITRALFKKILKKNELSGELYSSLKDKVTTLDKILNKKK